MAKGPPVPTAMIDLTEHITLENEVVLLRPLEIDDFRHLLRFSLQEPTLWQYSLEPADGEENLRTYLKVAMDARTSGTAYPFLVIDKRNGLFAGSTRFYDIQIKHNTAQLGFTWYGQEFQRTGLNKNCKYLLLEFAFERWKLDRVEFRADNKNARSIAAMKSIGCVVEGVLRSNCASPTGRRDSIVMSILKDEWFGGVKDRLKAKT